jgi:hypothetical protein
VKGIFGAGQPIVWDPRLSFRLQFPFVSTFEALAMTRRETTYVGHLRVEMKIVSRGGDDVTCVGMICIQVVSEAGSGEQVRFIGDAV